MATISQSVDAVKNQLYKSAVNAFWNFTQVACGVITMGLLNLRAMLVTAAIVPVLAMFAFLHARISGRWQVRYDKANQDCNREAAELLDNIQAIRSYGTGAIRFDPI